MQRASTLLYKTPSREIDEEGGQTGLIRQYIPKGTDMGKVTNNKRTASIQKTEGKGGTKMSGTLFGDSSFKCVNAFRIALREEPK